jgi:hypothetical protein
MKNEKDTATHAATHASPLNNTKTDGNDTPQPEHVNGAASPDIYHVFETKSSARAFRALIGEDHNIDNSAIGWQLGPVLQLGATAYLWPERLDSTGFKWIDDCAAISKATLKLPIPPKMGAPLFGYIRDRASTTELLVAMREAEPIESTNATTDRNHSSVVSTTKSFPQ